MIKPKFCKLWMLAALSVLVWGTASIASDPLPGGAKIIPTKYNNIDYLYVYGPRGKKTSGAEDSLQIIFYRVPRNSANEVTLFVYDPGSTGSLDKKSLFGKKTTTRFSVYGGSGAYSDPRSQSVIPSSDQPGTVLDTQTYVDEHEYEWRHTEDLGPERTGGFRGKIQVVGHAFFRTDLYFGTGSRPVFV